MGLDFAREAEYPENINDLVVRDNIIKGLNHIVIMNSKLNLTQKSFKSSLSNDILILARKYMIEYFKSRSPKSLKLLEIMSGNRISSDILSEQMQFSNWITTDICSFDSSSNLPFDQLNSINAVNKYGSDSNILLLVAPMPASPSINDDQQRCWAYADYYACHDFIEQKSDLNDRYIIFIGELGASDGTTGMYKYLNDHEKLQLELRKMLQTERDIFNGPVEKEIFIYKLL